MKINSLTSISAFTYFLFDSLSKRIVVAVSLAFSCLAAAFLFYKWSLRSFSGKKQAENKLPVRSPVFEQKIPQKVIREDILTDAIEPAANFKRKVGSFIADLRLDEMEIKERFQLHFPDEVTFSAKEALHFVQEAKELLKDEYRAKVFAYAISFPLIQRLVKLIKYEPDQFPETMRAYVALRYCEEKKLDAEDTVEQMARASLSSERLRYKFASRMVRRDPADLCNEIDAFDIRDEHLKGKIAEIALYHDADAFFANLNEFDLDDQLKRDYFLRGLIRSIDPADKLLSDYDYLFDLEHFPLELLELIYQTFHFGQGEIKKAIIEQKGQKTGPMEEDRAFALFLQKSPPELEMLGFHNQHSFFEWLPEPEKLSLIAILLFLNSIDDPQQLIKEPDTIPLLKEIAGFNDPFARFAVVALLLKFINGGESLARILDFYKGTAIKTDSYPKYFSLVDYACHHFFPERNDSALLEMGWKDPAFRKQMLVFLAELVLSERLDACGRKEILLSFLEGEAYQNPECLFEFSSCLSRRFIKELRNKQPPKQILLNSLSATLQNLGAPYNCSLNDELLARLKYKEEIGYYAQALEKLSSDEKSRLVPFFFRFLKLSAEEKMRDERYHHSEIAALFSEYGLDGASLDKWKKGTRSSVAELQARFPHFQSGNDHWDIQSELRKSFASEHLLAADYPEFYAVAIEEKEGKFPILIGKVFGALKKKKDDEGAQKKAISHLLSKLFAEKGCKEQLKLLTELGKLFPKNSDFGVDIKNWIKALNAAIEKEKKRYEEFEIVRSGDPYLLFRIGSIAGESCQRVRGDPAKNKCLLSYPCDGKNQVICSENSEGEVEARAILRFFYACDDSPRNKVLYPVLYLEPFYPSSTPQELRKAMTLAAIECAQSLNVPLVRHLKPKEEFKKDEKPPFHIVTINGPGPFEYYDGIAQQVKENHDSISTNYAYIANLNIKVLFDPKKPDEIRM